MARKEYKTYFASDNNGRCKIGRSEDVERRIKSLQTGNGNTLTLIHVVPGDHEKAFHRRFKAENCPAGREWFHLRGSLLEYLKKENVIVASSKNRPTTQVPIDKVIDLFSERKE